jgi:uncharacterized surface protein with fasciclin (FAS1) repeats
MKNTLKTLSLATAILGSTFAFSQQAMLTAKDNPMVGGMAMFTTKNIVENALNSADHTTLVAAVKAAGLVEALMGDGPFTVFAPVNSAFDMLPKGTVDKLLMAENKSMLTNVLTYHVVKGKWTFDMISEAIEKGDGTATLETLSGQKLWAMWNGPKNIVLKDGTGAIASITTYDVIQKNGVIHVINKVLMSK